MALTLTALADNTRRGAIEALGDGPLSAGELATRLDVTPAALSRHLRVLRQAGLVSVALDDADSRRHVYSVQPEGLVGLTDWARRVTLFWSSQLASYAGQATKDHQAIKGSDAGR
jgi:DNA-binding transcriptional ArsR family regulator